MRRLQAALAVSMLASLMLSCLLLNERQYRLIAEDKATQARAEVTEVSGKLTMCVRIAEACRRDYGQLKARNCST